MKRWLVALVMQLLSVAAPAHAQAQETIVKLGTAAPEDTPWHKQLIRLKAKFDKDSGGKIKLKLFMGSVKGGEDAMARQVAQGALQAAGLSTAALATLVPELDVFELPYRFASLEEADKVLDDPEVWDLVVKLFRKKGFEPFIWSENGWRSFASKTRPFTKPEDLKGAKMRAQENRVHIETYKALGASPVPIAIPEVLSALQTGVVDGFDNTPLFAFATSWYQGVKHWTRTEHIFQPGILVFNKAWFDALPADQKTALMSNRQEETAYGRAIVRKLSEPLLKNLQESGVEMHSLTAEQKAAFAKATKPVHARLRALLSAEGKQLFDLVDKKLKK